MMNILVTGANGQLGNQFKEVAQYSKDYNFIFTDLPELDISSEQEVEKAITEFQPQWIINCAAYTAVDKAETEAELANRINAEAPALLARLSDRFHCRLIHISTDYVFDGTRSRPYKEEHEKNPIGVYAQTKSLGEDLVLVNNPRSVVIRTSWLYSAFGNNFAKTVIRLAKEKGNLRVVADQVGTPTWAGDLAAAIMQVIAADCPPGVYHFSNEGVCSWYDFAKAIIELLEIEATIEPITTKDFPTAAPRPHYSVLDKNLLKSTLGITIPYWRDSLKVCLNQLNEQS
jgi:dTDP-4-dehydrorhamnose reductase